MADEPLVMEGTPGAAMFRHSVTITAEAERSAYFLTVASMLICTNDGFTGSTMWLPRPIGDTVVG